MTENTNSPKIFVHAGAAHMDEITAVALLWLLRPELIGTIPTRVNALPQDFRLGIDWALDIGMEFAPTNNIFDHHQTGAPADHCAASLLLSTLDPEFFEFLDRDPFPGTLSWFKVLRLVDTGGPFKFKKDHGALHGDVLGPVLTAMFEGPIEERNHAVKRLFHLMEGWRKKFEDQKAVDEEARKIPLQFMDVDGLNVAILDTNNPKFISSLERQLNWEAQNPAVVIFQDDRGEGLAMLRRGDHPRVNFAKIEASPHVSFAHKNGFICKTRSRLHPTISLALVRDALD
jgi:hypothetical protein